MPYQNFPLTLISHYPSSSLFHETRKEDIYNLIELLLTSNDINLQIKYLSVLGAYTMSNGTYAELIITYKPLYYKIVDILNSGQSIYTARARILNFLNVLLTYDVYNANRKSMTVFAGNMIRVSGCLATMSDLFVNCMMYQDTWVALCHCLAEACKCCRINQDYCSHLVPICVKKCNQDNIEVLLVLDSLLLDHDKNVKLFLLNNGVAIFTHSMLQQDICMQLLNTVARNPDAKETLRESKIVDYLHYFIKSYGQNSQIGQWSMVILFRLNPPNDEQQTTVKSIKKSFVTSPDEISIVQNNAFKSNDTTQLFQNIVKEIGNWKSKEAYFKKPLRTCNRGQFVNQDFRNRNLQMPNEKYNSRNNQHVGLKDSKVYPNISKTRETNKIGNTDLSFSTILNEMENEIRQQCNDTDLKRCYRYSNSGRNHLDVVEESFHDSEQDQFRTDYFFNESSEKGNNFQPMFTSTPTRQSPRNIPPIVQQRTIDRNISKAKKHKSNKQKKTKQFVKNEIKNTSLSSRFLSAINDSCTTLVKSVRNIFKTKEKSIQPSFETTVNTANEDISLNRNSFMKFMKKRDEALNHKTYSFNFSNNNFCQTCEDTQVLKSKLTSDKYLGETIKKLKVGINLYGCDFKKISRTIFSRENYMTPKILYSIYRKLIVK